MSQIREVLPSDVVPLIYKYLIQLGLKKTAEKVLKASSIDLQTNTSPLKSKKLIKIIERYILSNEEIKNQFQKEEEEVEKPLEAPKKNGKQQKETQQDEILPETSKKDVKEQKLEKKQKGKFFQMVNDDDIVNLPPELQDNTFEAKAKFGQGGDAYGEEGNEKLKNERGKGFRKGKDKLKNKAVCGTGPINVNSVNSIKLKKKVA